MPLKPKTNQKQNPLQKQFAQAKQPGRSEPKMQPQAQAAKPKARKDSHSVFLFSRENYLIMLAGIGVLVLGFLLMVGGGSSDPNQFHPEKIYSWRRITLAPIVIFIGFVIEIFAIMRKPKAQ